MWSQETSIFGVISNCEMCTCKDPRWWFSLEKKFKSKNYTDFNLVYVSMQLIFKGMVCVQKK